MMKMFRIITIIIVSFSSFLFAQLKDVQVSFENITPLGKRIGITDSKANGLSVRINYDIGSDLSFFINGGIQSYTIHQENAIARWDWRFWDRYDDYINITLQDPDYQSRIGVVQKMDLIPIMLGLSYSIEISNDFLLEPSIAGGVFIYTRRFYVEEYWQKYFEEIDYTFSYSYYNIAPQKKGNPIAFTTGLNARYILTDFLDLTMQLNYVQLVDTKGDLGFAYFPYNNAFNIAAGLVINY